jgi:uncharacterized protein (TIGR03435 family)
MRLLRAVFLLTVGALAVGVFSVFVLAQNDTPPGQSAAKRFEVASIKRNTSGSTMMTVSPLPGGRFVMVNASFRAVINFAYHPAGREITGGPGWLETERYDITAMGDPGSKAVDIEEMMRSLLADRLHFAMHYEERDRPIYAITVAAPDGRLGPDLRHTPTPCSRDGITTPNPTAANGAPLCGMSAGTTPRGTAVLKGGGISMSELAAALRVPDGRVAIDMTGLAGTYEFTLEYAPLPLSASSDSEGAQLITAMREQLGLALTAERAPLPVVVVDHVERPAQD